MEKFQSIKEIIHECKLNSFPKNLASNRSRWPSKSYSIRYRNEKTTFLVQINYYAGAV